MNICGTTEITYEQAMAFAKSKKATTVFISNATIYWRLCKKIGVNPCVAYCQYALESGWGKFGGVLDESYCNPCGLKNTSGGSCTDAKAHKKFKSWEAGISAHIDHLALYAGVKGYPKENTEDPRHFPYLLGTVKTVEKLSGTWAMNSSYSKNLINLINSLEAYKKTSSNSSILEDKKDEFLEGKNFKIYIKTSILNIRKEPSFTSKIVGTVKKGQVFTISEVINGLGKLKSGAGFISMNTEYVEKIKEVINNNNNGIKKPSKNEYKVRVVNCSYVNARKGPSNSYSVCSTIKAGTILTAIDETSDGWIKLKSGLYIYKNYLKKL